MEMGPGPMRHPKPLTAVDLYAQLEKEQEAVVNRLTRELSILRAAQNASVVSSTSSTSATGLPESCEYNVGSFLSGHSHPTPSYFRRHRSSSAASARSAAAANSVPMVSGNVASERGIGRTAPPRHDTGSTVAQACHGDYGLSRYNSGGAINTLGHGHSGASSPIAVPVLSNNSYPIHGGEPWPGKHSSYPSRPAPLRDYSSRSPSITHTSGEKELHANQRYDELTLYRIELENAKKENDILKRRIRELEGIVSSKKQLAISGTGGTNTVTRTSISESNSSSKTSTETGESKTKHVNVEV